MYSSKYSDLNDVQDSKYDLTKKNTSNYIEQIRQIVLDDNYNFEEIVKEDDNLINSFYSKNKKTLSIVKLNNNYLRVNDTNSNTDIDFKSEFIINNKKEFEETNVKLESLKNNNYSNPKTCINSHQVLNNCSKGYKNIYKSPRILKNKNFDTRKFKQLYSSYLDINCTTPKLKSYEVYDKSVFKSIFNNNKQNTDFKNVEVILKEKQLLTPIKKDENNIFSTRQKYSSPSN